MTNEGSTTATAPDQGSPAKVGGFEKLGDVGGERERSVHRKISGGHHMGQFMGKAARD